MKRFLALCLALSLVLTLAPALGEEEKVLNIFSWEGYVDETTIANFTAETGIAINYAAFASNEEMLMKLQANGASEYDIIIASDYILSLARCSRWIRNSSPAGKTSIPPISTSTLIPATCTPCPTPWACP